MAFYKAVNAILESLDTGKISGKELLQSYVMSLFDMEREATIVYDFLEDEGYLNMGMYMATGESSHDPDGKPNFYVIIPHSVIVGKHRFMLDFWDKWKALAKENNFHFLLKVGEDMLIQGKELVTSSFTVRKWRPMKKKTREHFGDILSGLNEEITTSDIDSSSRAFDRMKNKSAPNWVLLLLYYGTGSKKNVYIIKPVSKLKGKEKEFYKHMVRYKIESGYKDMFGVTTYLDYGDNFRQYNGLEYIIMHKGNKENLEKALEYFLTTHASDEFTEKKPIMGKKAQSHFGDIIDNL